MLAGDSILVFNSGAVITVTGCPIINGSVALQLTLSEEETTLLNGQGAINRTVLFYDVTCDYKGEFSIALQNTLGKQPKQTEKTDSKQNCAYLLISDACAVYISGQQNTPGSIVVLVTKKSVPCNFVTEPDALLIPDWAIAVIVVGFVVLAGIAIAIGLVVRKRKLDKQFASIGSTASVSNANHH